MYLLNPDAVDLTNLSFADDVILVAQSRSDVRKMLQDLSVAAAKYGLKIHFGKTRIMTWGNLAKPHTTIRVDSEDVKILEEKESERYLGRKLSIADSMRTELRNRIASGWASFHKHKGELCSKCYALSDRIRLFDTVVTPSVLYASSTWALTQSQESQLTTTRRRMLRYIFRVHRKGDEDWVTFVQRAAHKVDSISANHGMENWIQLYRKKKWKFAGHLARTADNRWSKLAVMWLPNNGRGRSRGAPCTRWSDQLQIFAGGAWMTNASDNADQWDASADVFASWDFSRKV